MTGRKERGRRERRKEGSHTFSSGSITSWSAIVSALWRGRVEVPCEVGHSGQTQSCCALHSVLKLYVRHKIHRQDFVVSQAHLLVVHPPGPAPII
jgi:hypothetical protein